MKISVITRHAITNYGSLLQALATQTVLAKLGHESEIIDYIRAEESYRKHEITLLKRKEGWDKSFVKRWIYIALRQPASILSGRRFQKERTKMLHLSRLYSSPEALMQNPPKADIYMTGSDQVWGPTEDGSYDSNYCLSFAPDGARKISYAASFGRTEMAEATQTFFRKWLPRYEQIAVREDSAVEFVQSLGMDAKQVIDPTLLLTPQEWEPYLGRKPKKKYVLVYQLHNDKKLGEYARKVAKAKGLPLIRISVSQHQITRPGKFLWCPPIGDFLSYVKNADCMITDSFHGTAFAIIFNTPFVEVLPNNKTGTRNASVLRLTGLSHRILMDENDVALAMQPIDFVSVNQILEEQRRKSLSILEELLAPRL